MLLLKKNSSNFLTESFSGRKTISILIIIIAFFVFYLALKPLNTIGTGPFANHIKDQQHYLQKEILTYAEIDSVLNTFQKITYYQLDKTYFTKIGYYGRPDEYKVSNCSFYRLVGKELYQNLVGKHKVNEFLPKDNAWKETYSILDTGYVQYFLIDKKVLYRFLDLINLLNDSGYNADALKFWMDTVIPLLMMKQAVRVLVSTCMEKPLILKLEISITTASLMKREIKR